VTVHAAPLEPVSVLPLLRGRFGRPYLWHADCPSTQDVLRNSALPEGAVAVAEHQTEGRGRSGRVWLDSPGESLLLSVLLRPPAEGRQAPELSLVAGLAVAEAIEAETRAPSAVKWPNDVVVAGLKVAGILLELEDDAVVCGIGINVNQEQGSLPSGSWAPAGSLRVVTGGAHDRARLLAGVLWSLEGRYDAWSTGGLGLLVGELTSRDWLADKRVQSGSVSGVGAGIAVDGRYRIRAQDGSTHLVESGEVMVL
jgi:BirA family transcriptional regulator, biotin operon repressor / biotin---[acetyl-CoA-carboxylase] ligase